MRKVIPIEKETPRLNNRQRTDHMLRRDDAGIGNLSYANEGELPPEGTQAVYDEDDAGSPNTIVAK